MVGTLGDSAKGLLVTGSAGEGVEWEALLGWTGEVGVPPRGGGEAGQGQSQGDSAMTPGNVARGEQPEGGRRVPACS